MAMNFYTCHLHTVIRTITLFRLVNTYLREYVKLMAANLNVNIILYLTIFLEKFSYPFKNYTQVKTLSSY